MEIQILGAHQLELKGTRLTSLLFDNTLVLDARPSKHGDWLKKVGHFCAGLLKEELIQFRRLKGYLPRVIVIHIGNPYEQEIKEEVAQVAQELEADISLGYEDMKVTL